MMTASIISSTTSVTCLSIHQSKTKVARAAILSQATTMATRVTIVTTITLQATITTTATTTIAAAAAAKTPIAIITTTQTLPATTIIIATTIAQVMETRAITITTSTTQGIVDTDSHLIRENKFRHSSFCSIIFLI